SARRFPESGRRLNESFERFKIAGDRWGLARAYSNLASIYISNQDPAQAREFLASCIAVCDETDDDETRRTATAMWGMTLLDEGDPDRAEELLRSSLAPTSADQDLRMVAHVLL